ncbi:nuclear transport factor 2 family protein [uncultured Winogradskyella sp.]|uniref:nuclear transport factor 2 family protein n=1 Tax=uncultured Winogradskyella sp. TaxID=395353 RepID=UPI0026137CCC|nr:nuclear transport factor 2 family protein [uncultured Winogradskyella sp.]
MKILKFISFCLYSSFILSQSNTEVFLFDLETNNSKIEVKNGKNISNNEGYDNQPSFLDDRYVVFASTRNGQTDIAKYDKRYNGKIWVNFTDGGEYTPLKIPNKNAVSAVRLDKDGKQRLYSYNLSNGESTELINDLVVAYYTWYDEHILVSAVIEDQDLNLFTTNLQEGTNRKYATKVGRSFHKIPNSNLVSYISKENESQWQIKSLNPLTGETNVIANTMQEVEDICWLDGKTILSGKDNILYKLRLQRDNDWKQVADLSTNGITKITRLAVNTSATKLLIAGDIGTETASTETTNETAEENTNTDTNTETSTTTKTNAGAIVQKHIKPYNDGNLDEFANAFSENVVVKRFPNTTISTGREQMKQGYTTFFKNNKNLSVLVNKRMVLNDMVVDEELATVNNNTIRQATIYKTSDKGIETMTFIGNQQCDTNPELIVNSQLNAYNSKNMDAFMATYTQDVKLYNYPNALSTSGQEEMRKGYASWFEQAKGLNAKVINRIVIGNKVIDKEEVKANGQTFYAIAIYEVENGLISKVTFIQ